MAEVEYSQQLGSQGMDPNAGSGLGGIVNLLGAVASVALLAGVGYWGYQLVMRDVSGVPVVRALEGPMRVQPDDPGGRPADHQGLAVNAVAAEGTAAAPADRLKLAPKPVDLAEDDAPLPTLARASSATAPVNEDETIEALVRQLTEGVEPLETLTQEQPQPEVEEPVAVIQNAVLTGPGLPRSLRPQPRPAKLTRTVVQPAQPSATVDIDPASLPVGTRLAQLGAYDSADIAKSEWVKLVAGFEDHFQGKSRVIQQASSGGRTFFRLRAMGFEDLSEARRFCSVLVADNADCIPVSVR